MSRIELVRPKNYKGHIRYFKGVRRSGGHFVEKDRSFRSEEYSVTEDDYYWCDNYNKASALWAYTHYCGTAFHYQGKNIHPRTKKSYIKGVEKNDE